MKNKLKGPTLFARFTCVGGVLLGLLMFCGCWYMVSACVRDAIREPDSEWGRSRATVEWAYAGLFAVLSVAGVAYVGGSLAWFHEDQK